MAEMEGLPLSLRLSVAPDPRLERLEVIEARLDRLVAELATDANERTAARQRHDQLDARLAQLRQDLSAGVQSVIFNAQRQQEEIAVALANARAELSAAASAANNRLKTLGEAQMVAFADLQQRVDTMVTRVQEATGVMQSAVTANDETRAVIVSLRDELQAARDNGSDAEIQSVIDRMGEMDGLLAARSQELAQAIAGEPAPAPTEPAPVEPTPAEPAPAEPAPAEPAPAEPPADQPTT